jgi:hypothetical protein
MIDDNKIIFEKYRNLNEDVGSGYGTPKSVEVTQVGSTSLPNNRTLNYGVEDQEMEYDGEIDMARSELYKLSEYSTKLYDLISNEQNLEGWVASKITRASDYISSVYHYLNHKTNMGEVNDYDVKM